MFYNLSSSLAPWYNSVSKMHVTTYEKLVKEEEVMADIKEKNVPRDYAIVLLCPDGSISLKLHSLLEKSSYTNVYVVNGGYQQILAERE